MLPNPSYNGSARSGGARGGRQHRACKRIAPLRPYPRWNRLSSSPRLRYKAPPRRVPGVLKRQRPILRRIRHSLTHGNNGRRHRLVLRRAIEHPRSPVCDRAGTGDHGQRDHGCLGYIRREIEALPCGVWYRAPIPEHGGSGRLLSKVHTGELGLRAGDPRGGNWIKPIRRQWSIRGDYHAAILSAWRAPGDESAHAKQMLYREENRQSQYKNRRPYWTERSVNPSISTTTLRPVPPEAATVSVGAPPGVTPARLMGSRAGNEIVKLKFCNGAMYLA